MNFGIIIDFTLLSISILNIAILFTNKMQLIPLSVEVIDQAQDISCGKNQRIFINKTMQLHKTVHVEPGDILEIKRFERKYINIYIGSGYHAQLIWLIILIVALFISIMYHIQTRQKHYKTLKQQQEQTEAEQTNE